MAETGLNSNSFQNIPQSEFYFFVAIFELTVVKIIYQMPNRAASDFRDGAFDSS